MGAALPSHRGDHLLWPRCGVMPLRGLCRSGLVGGDKLCVPPSQADPAHGQHGHSHTVSRQQHDQPGHVRGVPYQHAGMDDPVAGAQQGQGAPPGLHARQCGHGHHDCHEHRPLLPAAQERLLKEQYPGSQERERDIERKEEKHSILKQKLTRYCKSALCD